MRMQAEGRRRYVEGALHVQCTRCEKWWPRTTEFFKAEKHSSDGLAAQCRGCQREVVRRYFARHPERLAQRRQYRIEWGRRKRRGQWVAEWREAMSNMADLLTEGRDDEDGTDAV